MVEQLAGKSKDLDKNLYRRAGGGGGVLPPAAKTPNPSF
jgi:hypothetical protein